RLGERYPLPGHQAKSERRHQKRYRSRLPRRFSRPQQDLRKNRRRVLGLSRLATGSAKLAARSTFAGSRQASLRHRLTAITFAPITVPRIRRIAISHPGLIREGLATESTARVGRWLGDVVRIKITNARRAALGKRRASGH